jgi:hypothetical protein
MRLALAEHFARDIVICATKPEPFRDAGGSRATAS